MIQWPVMAPTAPKGDHAHDHQRLDVGAQRDRQQRVDDDQRQNGRLEQAGKRLGAFLLLAGELRPSAPGIFARSLRQHLLLNAAVHLFG